MKVWNNFTLGLCLLSLIHLCVSSVSVNFAASAPCSYYHETGGGAYNDGTLNSDISTSLESRYFNCGDFVSYLIKVDRNQPGGGCGTGSFKLSFNGAQTGVAIEHIAQVVINSGNVQNGAGSSNTNNDARIGTNSCNNNIAVSAPDTDSAFSSSTSVCGTKKVIVSEVVGNGSVFNGAKLDVTIEVTNIEEVETFVIRIDGRLNCHPTISRSGNLAATLSEYDISGSTGAPSVSVAMSSVSDVQGASFPGCSQCGRGCEYCGSRGRFNPLTCECECFNSWIHPSSTQPDCSVCPASASKCLNGATFDAATCSCSCSSIMDSGSQTPAVWSGSRCQTCDADHNCGAGTLVNSGGRCYCNCNAGATALATEKGVVCVSPLEVQCITEHSTVYHTLEKFFQEAPSTVCSTFFPGPGIGQTSFKLDGTPNSWSSVLNSQTGNIVDATHGTRQYLVDSPGRNFFQGEVIQRSTNENGASVYLGNHNQQHSWIADHNAKLSTELNQLFNPNANKELRPEFWTWQSDVSGDLVPEYTDLLHGFAVTVHAPKNCHSNAREEPYIFFGSDRKTERSYPNTANCVDAGKVVVTQTDDTISSLWSTSDHFLAHIYREYSGAFADDLGRSLLGQSSTSNVYQAGYVLVSAECGSTCDVSFLVRSADHCDSFDGPLKILLRDSNNDIVGSNCIHTGATFDSELATDGQKICDALTGCAVCSVSGTNEFQYIQFQGVPLGKYTVEVIASMTLHQSLFSQTVRTPVTCLNLQSEISQGSPAESSVSWWFNQKEIVPVNGFSYPYSPCQDNFKDPIGCNDFTGARTKGDLLISAEITEDFSDLVTTGSCNPWKINDLQAMKMRPRVHVWDCDDIELCKDPLMDITEAIATDVMTKCIASGRSCSECQNICGNPLICNSQCPFAYVCVTTNTQPTTAVPPLRAHLEPRTFFEGGLMPHTLMKVLDGMIRPTTTVPEVCTERYEGVIYGGKTIDSGIAVVTFGDYLAPDAAAGESAVNFEITMTNGWAFTKIDLDIGQDSLSEVSNKRDKVGQYAYSNLDCDYTYTAGDDIFVSMTGDGTLCTHATISVPMNKVLKRGSALTCDGDTAFKMHFDAKSGTKEETAYVSCCTDNEQKCPSNSFDKCNNDGSGSWYWRAAFNNCCGGTPEKPKVKDTCWPGLCYTQVLFTSQDGLKECSTLRDFIFADDVKTHHCISSTNQISRNGLMKCHETGNCFCDGDIDLSTLLGPVERDECLCADCVPKASQPPLPSITPSNSLSSSVSATPSTSPSSSLSISATATPTPSRTASRSPSPTISDSNTPSSSPSPTASVSLTATATRTASRSVTPSRTPSRTYTPTASHTSGVSDSATGTPTPSTSLTSSRSISASASSSRTPSVTPTETTSRTPSRTATRTASATTSESPSRSSSPTITLTSSQSVTSKPSESSSASASFTPSVSITPSVTMSLGGDCIDTSSCPQYHSFIKAGKNILGGDVRVEFGEYLGERGRQAINFYIQADTANDQFFKKIDLDIGEDSDVADERGAIGQYNYANLECGPDVSYPHTIDNVKFHFDGDQKQQRRCTSGVISVPFDLVLKPNIRLGCASGKTFFKMHFDYADGETAYMDCCDDPVNTPENGCGPACCDGNNDITGDCTAKLSGGGGPWYFRMGIDNCCPYCPPPSPEPSITPTVSTSTSPSASVPAPPSRPCIDDVSNIAVLIDVSGSIERANAQETVRKAVTHVVNILENSNANLAYIRFSGPPFDQRGTLGDAVFISDVNGDHYRSMRDKVDVTSLRSEIVNQLKDSVFGDFTNWEAAFTRAGELTPKPDVIIFITDGNPTVSIGKNSEGRNGNNEDYFAYQAVKASAPLKSGARIISLLVGEDIDEKNILNPIQSDGRGYSFPNGEPDNRRISSIHSGGNEPVLNEDYFLTSFTSLKSQLDVVFNNLCPDPNPPQCVPDAALQVVIIVDTSGSIRNAGAQGDMRAAVETVTSTLEGSNAKIAVVKFSGPLDFNTDAASSNAQWVTDGASREGRYRNLYDSEINTLRSEVNSKLADNQFGGATNWESAFQRVYNGDMDADIILFLTDGNPTAINGRKSTNDDCDKDRYAHEVIKYSKVLKRDGARIIPVLIGDNIDEDYIIKVPTSDGCGLGFSVGSDNDFISSATVDPDLPEKNTDYFKSSFEQLPGVLNTITRSFCPDDDAVQCDTIRISVIVDVSGSIRDANAQSTVRGAVNSIIDTLDGTSAYLSLLRFSGPSSGSGSDNDSTFITGAYVNMGTPSAVSSLKTSIPSELGDSKFGGYTNWEAAFKKVDTLSPSPDIVIFVTDGNPTTSINYRVNADGSDEDFYAHQALTYTESLKEKGARIIGLLIGEGINVENVAEPITENGRGIYDFDPSGNFILSDTTGKGSAQDLIDYHIAEFSQLVDSLDVILRDVCSA